MKKFGALLFFLLCLCECGAQGERERVLTMEQRLTLLEARLSAVVSSMDHEAEADLREYYEKKMDGLAKQNEDLVAQLSILEMRLNTTDSELEQVKRNNADLTSQLQDLQRDDLVAQLSTLEVRLNDTERQNADQRNVSTDLTSQLQDLQRDVGPKVGFSAALADGSVVSVGPAASQTLVFKHVYFNNGNAYSRSTGQFTAPQKGAYYFTFRTQGSSSSSYRTGAKLMKNGQGQVSIFKEKGQSYDSTSGAVILDLNAGDTVNVMSLDSSYQLYDDIGHLTTFSGFLLFPL